MTKTPTTKKMIKLMLSVAAAMIIFFALSLSASAASYPTVKLNVPRISQCPGRGDCAIASMATVEAYCHDLLAGNHNSTAYQAVYSANGYSVSAMWSKIGYKTVDGFSMTTAYNQLKTGYPIIVHRTSQHYSVIYGYDGNSSQLELSGFLVVDVDDSYNSSTAYFRLDKWRRSGSLDRMVIRQNGLAISTDGIRITNNHPAKNTAKGESFTPYGVITSGSDITNVNVSVSTESGTVKQSYNATPNAKSFNISKASDKIKIDSLGSGSYVYEISAKNSAGKSDKYTFKFTVGAVSSQPDEKPDVEIKDVSYKAIVRAEPCLNMRKGAGIEYEVIDKIPDGTIIDVTGECNGWARVKYNSRVGWVSIDYIAEYMSAPDVDDTPSAPPQSTVVNYYARAKSELSLKENTSSFSSTLVKVPKGAIVRVVAESDGWIKFSYKGNLGWVYASNCVTGLGDIDVNGQINSADALIVLKHTTGSQTLSSKQKEIADFDGDGKVNSADALLILQVATGSKRYE